MKGEGSEKNILQALVGSACTDVGALTHLSCSSKKRLVGEGVVSKEGPTVYYDTLLNKITRPVQPQVFCFPRGSVPSKRFKAGRQSATTRIIPILDEDDSPSGTFEKDE